MKTVLQNLCQLIGKTNAQISCLSRPGEGTLKSQQRTATSGTPNRFLLKPVLSTQKGQGPGTDDKFERSCVM